MAVAVAIVIILVVIIGIVVHLSRRPYPQVSSPEALADAEHFVRIRKTHRNPYAGDWKNNA